MVRNILGFSVFAVLALIAIKFIFAIVGGLAAIFWTVLWLAFWGWIFYLILKIFAPNTAARVRETIRGKPAA